MNTATDIIKRIENHIERVDKSDAAEFGDIAIDDFYVPVILSKIQIEAQINRKLDGYEWNQFVRFMRDTKANLEIALLILQRASDESPFFDQWKLQEGIQS